MSPSVIAAPAYLAMPTARTVTVIVTPCIDPATTLPWLEATVMLRPEAGGDTLGGAGASPRGAGKHEGGGRLEKV